MPSIRYAYLKTYINSPTHGYKHTHVDTYKLIKRDWLEPCAKKIESVDPYGLGEINVGLFEILNQIMIVVRQDILPTNIVLQGCLCF